MIRRLAGTGREMDDFLALVNEDLAELSRQVSEIGDEVRSIFFFSVKSNNCLVSVTLTSKQSAISAMPAFPGAAKIRPIPGLWLSFQTIACSRAPCPITSTFLPISAPPV